MNPPPLPNANKKPSTKVKSSRVPAEYWNNWLGTIVAGRYKITRVLGIGGMGTVFEADHLDLRRKVALKVLNPAQAAKPTALQRFHNEARAAGGVSHPNLCEIYDVGTLPDGSPFLVMECLIGEPLSTYLAKARKLGFLPAVEILVDVLDGLHATHGRNVIHRDVKPENVFLVQEPYQIAKVVDFGVSKIIGPLFEDYDEEELSLTRTGMVMGTPYYMSAEQARGDRDLDQRVDVYAAGVLLYEMLSGKRPYVAPNYNALLLQIISKPPRPIRELCPDLPPGFESIVEKAMDRDRRRRFQTAGEFRRALVGYCNQSGMMGRWSNMARRLTSRSVAPPPRAPKLDKKMLPTRAEKIASLEDVESYHGEMESISVELVTSDRSMRPSRASRSAKRISVKERSAKRASAGAIRTSSITEDKTIRMDRHALGIPASTKRK